MDCRRRSTGAIFRAGGDSRRGAPLLGGAGHGPKGPGDGRQQRNSGALIILDGPRDLCAIALAARQVFTPPELSHGSPRRRHGTSRPHDRFCAHSTLAAARRSGWVSRSYTVRAMALAALSIV